MAAKKPDVSDHEPDGKEAVQGNLKSLDKEGPPARGHTRKSTTSKNRKHGKFMSRDCMI
jgi:hypothetical protein